MQTMGLTPFRSNWPRSPAAQKTPRRRSLLHVCPRRQPAQLRVGAGHSNGGEHGGSSGQGGDGGDNNGGGGSSSHNGGSGEPGGSSPSESERLGEQSFGKEILAQLVSINGKLEQQSGEVGQLRGEVGQLRGEVGQLRGEVGQLSGEVGQLSGEVGQLSGEVGQLSGEVGQQSGEVGQQSGELDQQSGKLDQQSGKLDQQSGKLDRVDRSVGDNSEAIVRSRHPDFESKVIITALNAVEDLAEAVSSPAYPASGHALLAAVLEAHCGYHALARLLLHRVRAEVPQVAPLVTAVADAASWGERARGWVRLLNALEERRSGGWWEGFLAVLKDYCSTVAASPTADCTTQLSNLLLERRRDWQPALALIVATAAGKLRKQLELDGLAPVQLQSSPPTITLRLLEAKRNVEGASKAVPQLLTAAKVVVWGLHTGNPELAASGTVEVEGIAGFVGKVTPSRLSDWEELAGRMTAVELPGLPPAVLRLRLTKA